MTPRRRKVLKALSLLPAAGVSRRMIFEVMDKPMQDELISLENEGYVICSLMENGRTIRLSPILEHLVRWAFFRHKKTAGNFLRGFIFS